MKTFITIAILAFSCTSFAWSSRDAASKEYTFKYNLSGQTLELKKSAGSYEEAYEQAAQQCFSFYKGAGKSFRRPWSGHHRRLRQPTLLRRAALMNLAILLEPPCSLILG
ncbi:hypothetical protein [Bdellovibrio bacteriovorus]|uniref:hypothetical protein n=1 Tax=Bdellovibrio bacteriovorus TaxID=959 RepID=UPI0035A5E82D